MEFLELSRFRDLRKSALALVLTALILTGTGLFLAEHKSSDKETQFYAGTSTGKILGFQDGSFKKVGSTNGVVHRVKKAPDSIMVSRQRGSSYSIVDVSTQEPYFFPGESHGFLAAGSQIYVALEDKNKVMKYNRTSGKQLGEASTGDGPHMITAFQDMLVTGNSDGTLTFIEPQTMEVEKTLRLGQWVGGLDSEDGKLYVTYRKKVTDGTGVAKVNVTKGFIGIIESGNLRESRALGVTRIPHGIERTDDGVAVSNLPTGEIYLWKPQSGKILNTSIGGSGKFHTSDIVDSRGSVFVADTRKQKVYRFNISNWSLEEKFEVPNLHSISEPDPHPAFRTCITNRTAFVVNIRSNDLSVIDLCKSEEVKRLQLGSEPHGMIFTNDTMYVSNYFENYTNMFDLDSLEPSGRAFVHFMPHEGLKYKGEILFAHPHQRGIVGLNLSTNKISRVVKTSLHVERIDINRKSDRIFLAGIKDPKTPPGLAVIENGSVVTNKWLSYVPHDIKYHEGLLYVSQRHGNLLKVYNSSSMEIVDQVEVGPRVEDQLFHGQVSNEIKIHRNQIFVSSPVHDTIKSFYIQNLSISQEFSADTPEDFVVTDKRIYSVSRDNDILEIIQKDTGLIVKTLRTGQSPHEIVLRDQRYLSGS